MLRAVTTWHWLCPHLSGEATRAGAWHWGAPVGTNVSLPSLEPAVPWLRAAPSAPVATKARGTAPRATVTSQAVATTSWCRKPPWCCSHPTGLQVPTPQNSLPQELKGSSCPIVHGVGRGLWPTLPHRSKQAHAFLLRSWPQMKAHPVLWAAQPLAPSSPPAAGPSLLLSGSGALGWDGSGQGLLSPRRAEPGQVPEPHFVAPLKPCGSCSCSARGQSQHNRGWG